MKKKFNYFVLLLMVSGSFSTLEVDEDNETTEIMSPPLPRRSQFRKILLEKKQLFVDKSMFIAALLNSTYNTEIILRPPKWGKSFNLEMTEMFFDIRYDVNGTVKPWLERDIYFKGGVLYPKISNKQLEINLKPLEISKHSTSMEEMGKHPVLFLSFKGFDTSYENFRKCTRRAIGDIIIKKKYAFLSQYCSDALFQAKYCKNLLENPRKALQNDYILERSFYILSAVLSEHSGQGVIVLIDDYDYPLNSISHDNDLSSILNFQNEFFSNIMKQGELPVYKFIITGNLLNLGWKFLHLGANAGSHLVTYHTVLDKKYSSYFGFTKQEIKKMLNKGEYSVTTDDIENWHGGYFINDKKMHQPYSVFHCLAESGNYQAHWLENDATGLEEYSPVDKFLNGLLLEDYRQRSLQELCYRHSSKLKVTKEVNFKSKLLYDEFASILTFLGYLTIARLGDKTYEVMIPNQQIKDFTLLSFKHWILSKNCMKQTRELKTQLESITMSLAKGNHLAIQRLLNEILPQIDIIENTHCEMIFALLHYSTIPWELNRTFIEHFGSKWDCIITMTPPANDILRPFLITVGTTQIKSREWKRSFKEILRENDWPFLNQFLVEGANITSDRIIYDVFRFVKNSFEGSYDLKILAPTSTTKTKVFVGVYEVAKYRRRNPFKALLNFIRRREESVQLATVGERPSDEFVE